MDPFLIELIVLRKGAYQGAEQRALSRGVETGLLLRLRRAVFVDRVGFESLTPEARHVVRLRALAAVANGPVVVSHWSAAAVLGLPILDRTRLERLHLTVSSRRSAQGCAAHLRPLTGTEVQQVGELLVTTPARTAVDIAAASSFAEGVVTVDGALRRGVGRIALEAALDLAEHARGASVAADVVAFGHRDAESAGESLSRCTMLRLGVAPPVLQRRFFDWRGFVARTDFFDEARQLAGEADGRVKLLDPAMAQQGAGKALWAEKRREDRLLGCVHRLARWGYEEAGSPVLLGRVLAAIGWLADAPRAVMSDYIAAARPFG